MKTSGVWWCMSEKIASRKRFALRSHQLGIPRNTDCLSQRFLFRSAAVDILQLLPEQSSRARCSYPLEEPLLLDRGPAIDSRPRNAARTHNQSQGSPRRSEISGNETRSRRNPRTTSGPPHLWPLLSFREGTLIGYFGFDGACRRGVATREWPCNSTCGEGVQGGRAPLRTQDWLGAQASDR